MVAYGLLALLSDLLTLLPASALSLDDLLSLLSAVAEVVVADVVVLSLLLFGGAAVDAVVFYVLDDATLPSLLFVFVVLFASAYLVSDFFSSVV